MGVYDMDIKFGPLIHAEMDPSPDNADNSNSAIVTPAHPAFRVSIADVYEDRVLNNGICELVVPCITVNGEEPPSEMEDPDHDYVDQDGYSHFWVGGKHLSIRSSITSNIRVVRTDRGITLTGITDV